MTPGNIGEHLIRSFANLILFELCFALFAMIFVKQGNKL